MFFENKLLHKFHKFHKNHKLLRQQLVLQKKQLLFGNNLAFCVGKPSFFGALQSCLKLLSEI